MPTELLNALPQLTAVVEKLGVIGVLIIAVVWLIYERLRLMKQGHKTFAERDCCRQVQERYRSALLANNIPLPDTSDILKLYEAEKAT